MTNILIPIPLTPVIDMKTGKMVREWYRYFSLLQQALPDTNVIGDMEIYAQPSGETGSSESATPLDLGASDQGRIEELQTQAGGLNPQIPGPVELGAFIGEASRNTPFPMVPTEFNVLGRDIPFPMPPTELGSLEAAKNSAYRVVAAGNVDLVLGTATVLNVNANSANEFSLTTKVVGGTQGILSIGTVIANASFVVNSSDAADTSTVSWVIFVPIKG